MIIDSHDNVILMLGLTYWISSMLLKAIFIMIGCSSVKRRFDNLEAGKFVSHEIVVYGIKMIY